MARIIALALVSSAMARRVREKAFGQPSTLTADVSPQSYVEGNVKHTDNGLSESVALNESSNRSSMLDDVVYKHLSFWPPQLPIGKPTECKDVGLTTWANNKFANITTCAEAKAKGACGDDTAEYFCAKTCGLPPCNATSQSAPTGKGGLGAEIGVSCTIETGGTCSVFSCHASRNAECDGFFTGRRGHSHLCLCSDGYCAVAGVCVPKDAGYDQLLKDDNKYDEQKSIMYAKLAGASYCADPVITSWTCGSKCFPGVTDVHVCPTDSGKAFVGKMNGTCFASFEGTAGSSAMMTDAHVTWTTAPTTGNVHTGFWGLWQAQKPCVTKALESMGCKSAPLGMTGHSLGGATVTVAAADLSSEGYDILEVYTFGSPRPGDWEFSSDLTNRFEGKFFRVTHERDPFVDLPPQSFGCFHVEPEVFYDGPVSSGYTICNARNDKSCSAKYGFLGFKAALGGSHTAPHHNYMDVDTTQAGCSTGEKVTCGTPIKDSWCNLEVGCNKDTRGEHVYCANHNIVSTGPCACEEGYCNVGGKCVAKNEVPADQLAPGQ